MVKTRSARFLWSSQDILLYKFEGSTRIAKCITMTHLWEMETLWFEPPRHETISATFTYKSWAEFQECKPHKLWKPYILSSWSWKSKSQTDAVVKGVNRDPKKHVLEFRATLASFKQEEPPVSAPEIQKLQIVFLSPSRFDGMHRVEIVVNYDDEDSIREWLKNHMPSLWKL
jgi:hypothetical protein